MIVGRVCGTVLGSVHTTQFTIIRFPCESPHPELRPAVPLRCGGAAASACLPASSRAVPARPSRLACSFPARVIAQGVPARLTLRVCTVYMQCMQCMQCRQRRHAVSPDSAVYPHAPTSVCALNMVPYCASVGGALLHCVIVLLCCAGSVRPGLQSACYIGCVLHWAIDGGCTPSACIVTFVSVLCGCECFYRGGICRCTDVLVRLYAWTAEDGY